MSKNLKESDFFFLYWYLYFDCHRVVPCDQSFRSSDSDCSFFPSGSEVTSPVESSSISIHSARLCNACHPWLEFLSITYFLSLLSPKGFEQAFLFLILGIKPTNRLGSIGSCSGSPPLVWEKGYSLWVGKSEARLEKRKKKGNSEFQHPHFTLIDEKIPKQGDKVTAME